MRTGVQLSLLCLLSLLVHNSTVTAYIIDVTSNLDDGAGCTLREAVANANEPVPPFGSQCTRVGAGSEATISLDIAGQGIDLLLGQLDVTGDMAIIGTVRNRITAAAGAMVFNVVGAELELVDLELRGNGEVGSFGQEGGALISCTSTGALVITECTLRDGESAMGSPSDADSTAGAIWGDSCDLDMTDSLVRDNSATNGVGGVAMINALVVNIDGSTFLSNDGISTTGSGAGALKVSSEATATIADVSSCRFELNVGGSGGGIFFFADAANVMSASVEDCDFIQNTAERTSGGAIRSAFTNLSLRGNNDFISNMAMDIFPGIPHQGFGGAIAIADGSLSTAAMAVVTFDDNQADRLGGAIYADTNGLVTLNLASATFTFNTAIIGGGAIYSVDSDISLVAGELVAETNTASASSEGGFMRSGGMATVTVTNPSRVSGSSAAMGGAIYAQSMISISGPLSFSGNSGLQGAVLLSATSGIDYNSPLGDMDITDNTVLPGLSGAAFESLVGGDEIFLTLSDDSIISGNLGPLIQGGSNIGLSAGRISGNNFSNGDPPGAMVVSATVGGPQVSIRSFTGICDNLGGSSAQYSTGAVLVASEGGPTVTIDTPNGGIVNNTSPEPDSDLVFTTLGSCSIGANDGVVVFDGNAASDCTVSTLLEAPYSVDVSPLTFTIGTPVVTTVTFMTALLPLQETFAVEMVLPEGVINAASTIEQVDAATGAATFTVDPSGVGIIEYSLLGCSPRSLLGTQVVGNPTPSPTMTRTKTPTSSFTSSRTPTGTITPTGTPLISETASITRSPSATPPQSLVIQPPVPPTSPSASPVAGASRSASTSIVSAASASRTRSPSTDRTQTCQTSCGVALGVNPVQDNTSTIVTLVGTNGQPVGQVDVPAGAVDPDDLVVTGPGSPAAEEAIATLPAGSSVVNVVILTSSGEERQPDGEVEVCLEVTDKDEAEKGCLAFFEEVSGRWICEDKCLSINDDGFACGNSDHLTNFAVLFTGGGGGSSCGSSSEDYIFDAAWQDAILAASVFACVCMVCVVIAAIALLVPATNRIHGREYMRVRNLRSVSVRDDRSNTV